MQSDAVVIHFPPVKFEKGLEYLKGITGSMALVVSDFSSLKDEQQMVDFKYPSWVSETMREYRNGRYSMNSDGFKEFNTAITAINLLKSCAKLNLAIYALRDKYKAEEIELAKNSPSGRYDSSNYFTHSSYANPAFQSPSDENVLKIKNAAIEARDKIQAYSKKHTLPNFEQEFISTFKYTVYRICDMFFVNTKTLTEKAADTGGNCLGTIFAIFLFGLLLSLVGKCVASQ